LSYLPFLIFFYYFYSSTQPQMENYPNPQPTPPPYNAPPSFNTPPPYTPSSPPSNAMSYADGVALTETLKATGVSSATIYSMLTEKGLDHASAIQIIESTLPGGQLSQKEGRNDMIIGGLWIVGGLVLTIGSYMMVSESGGRYLITYGPIIYGIIRFFKGVSKM
jgi:hypothetical protein